MVTLITKGIKITVIPSYREDFSNSEKQQYLFSYKVSIENNNDYSVQLMKRHWYIFDSNSTYSEVSGEGVVGQTPVIEPGDVYEYESACNLKTEIGKMHGTYLMQRSLDGNFFKVEIPEFELIATHKLN
jgi:ApaG protein